MPNNDNFSDGKTCGADPSQNSRRTPICCLTLRLRLAFSIAEIDSHVIPMHALIQSPQNLNLSRSCGLALISWPTLRVGIEENFLSGGPSFCGNSPAYSSVS